MADRAKVSHVRTACTKAWMLADGVLGGIAHPAFKTRRGVSAKTVNRSSTFCRTSSGVPKASTALGSMLPNKTARSFSASCAVDVFVL